MDYNLSKAKAIRQNLNFLPDDNRVITKLFGLDKIRIYKIFDRVLKLSDKEKKVLLNRTIKNFDPRHKNIKRILFN